MLAKLIDLPLADVETGMGGVDPLTQDVHYFPPGRVGEAFELLEVLLSDPLVECLERNSHQHGPVDGRLVIYQLGGDDDS